MGVNSGEPATYGLDVETRGNGLSGEGAVQPTDTPGVFLLAGLRLSITARNADQAILPGYANWGGVVLTGRPSFRLVMWRSSP